MDRLPEGLRRQLDGADLEAKVGETFLLLTVDEDGFPRVALLSAGEIVAVSERELRLALWPGTTTSGSLARDGRATLAAFGEGAAFYVRLRARALDALGGAGGELTAFAARVEAVREDRVDYARITHGVGFELGDRESVLPRWRATVEALRALEAGA